MQPSNPSLTAPALAPTLAAEADRLLAFVRRSACPGGFGWLDDDGRLLPRDLELWITCRMTHVAALAHLLGRPGFDVLTDHGVTALATTFHDLEYGGWYASIRPIDTGKPMDDDKGGVSDDDESRPAAPGVPADGAKQAYGHAFVILAASSAVAAGRPGAADLLADALAVHERWFWDEDAGMARESFDRTFTESEDYRGVNANMHTVEAYLAAADVTGDRRWLDRAARITTRVLDGWARGNGWRIPEHFDAGWAVRLEYNADQPAHPFRPYGATPGHALEWSRLALSLRAALGPDEAPDWIVPAAQALVRQAIDDGWAVDGTDGFVYTTDWTGTPVVRQRMHWVLAEAMSAALALHLATGDPAWEQWFGTWWDYADRYLVDRERGSWHHELDPANRPSATTWIGKPDVYHAFQTMTAPRLPLHPSYATALRQGLAAPVPTDSTPDDSVPPDLQA